MFGIEIGAVATMDYDDGKGGYSRGVVQNYYLFNWGTVHLGNGLWAFTANLRVHDN